jgi:hypothetical protein
LIARRASNEANLKFSPIGVLRNVDLSRSVPVNTGIPDSAIIDYSGKSPIERVFVSSLQGFDPRLSAGSPNRSFKVVVEEVANCQGASNCTFC